MTKAELIAKHLELHKSLDQLMACHIENTDRNLSNTTLMEFMQWSFKQTQNPSCYKAPSGDTGENK